MIILFKDRNFEIDYENNDWYFDMKKYLPLLIEEKSRTTLRWVLLGWEYYSLLKAHYISGNMLGIGIIYCFYPH